MKIVALLPKVGVRPPCVDMVLPSTGLLTFSMDQMHAALDSCPQMFANMTKEDGKKEEKGEDAEHVGQDVALDGQGQDAASGELKDGGPSTMA